MLLIWLLYFITDIYGHIALKMASNQSSLMAILFTPWGITAGLSWVVSGISWTLVLSKSPLLSANTISALTYVFISLAAVVFFKEQLTLSKAVGMLLVFAGVYLVNR
jgi:drug/metabolite transporter (DMT)-like permease